MKTIKKILHKISFASNRRGSNMNCHYCGRPFAVARKRINMVLFACDNCNHLPENKPNERKNILTDINEFYL